MLWVGPRPGVVRLGVFRGGGFLVVRPSSPLPRWRLGRRPCAAVVCHASLSGPFPRRARAPRGRRRPAARNPAANRASTHRCLLLFLSHTCTYRSFLGSCSPQAFISQLSVSDRSVLGLVGGWGYGSRPHATAVLPVSFTIGPCWVSRSYSCHWDVT